MFDIFTAWDPIMKSSQSEKLLNVATVLQDKNSTDITFSAVDLEGNINKYILGSIEGNSKFLLGYVNPGFRVCPYHYIILDPNITEEESNKLFEERGHPSNPRFWLEKGVEPFLEGDEEGITHPSFVDAEDREIDNTKEFIWQNQSFLADPELQVIYSLSEDKVYDWNLLRNTYFASQNEEIYGLMELARIADSVQLESNTPIQEVSKSYRIYNWDENVVPIIKSISKPGDVYRIGKSFAIFSSDSIEFYEANGLRTVVDVGDNTLHEISLCPDEGPGSLVLLDFIDQYMNIDTSLLSTYVE